MLKDYALHYYEQGYNCAESLVGEGCGALTGAVCALGWLIVNTKAHDCAELKPLTQAVVEQVRQRLGSLRCEEIKPRLFQPERRCAATVENCADILEAVLRDAGLLPKPLEGADETAA